MINGFGDRLRAARKESKLSVPDVVDHFNTYFSAKDLKTINASTYYSWERFGTVREIRKGKSYPHPTVYPLALELFGVTAHWLFFGDQGGKIIRYTSDLPNKTTDKLTKQQLYVLKEDDQLDKEFTRVKSKMSTAQKVSFTQFLRTLR